MKLKVFSKYHKKERLILIVIFLMPFLLRLYFTFANNRPLDGDEWAYDNLASNLLQHHEFSLVKGHPTAYITPLYPIFLSIIYFLFGHKYIYARIIQALLGSLVCLVTYFIVKEVFNKPIALLTLFFMSIHYFFIIYGTLLLSENLFIFLVALSILFLIRFCKNPSYLYAGLFGLMSSLTTLTRSAYFLFPFMVIIILFLRPNFINLAYKKLIKLSLIIILCFIFPISIWTIRNYLVLKSFIPLCTEAGIVLYAAYNPPEGKILDSSVHDETTLRYADLSEVEGCRFLLKQTILSIKKDPSKIYKYIPLKIMYFFSVFDWVAFKTEGAYHLSTAAYNFSTAFILPLSFLGIILGFRKKFSCLKFIVLLPVIYFLLITITIMGVPRMRLPVEPYLIIFAAFFVNYIYSHSRFKGRIVCAISIWYFFNYFLYLNSPNAKLFVRFIFQKLGLW